MAFALTSFYADGVRFMGPGPYAATQHVVMTITGLTTDVDLDIGDLDGTFWTDAIADATYGEMATQALATVGRIVGQAQITARVYVPQLQARLQAAAASGTDYTLSLDSDTGFPLYTFAASNGELAYTVFVDILLNPTVLPYNIAYNVQIP
jgi:hypothetical protein